MQKQWWSSKRQDFSQGYAKVVFSASIISAGKKIGIQFQKNVGFVSLVKNKNQLELFHTHKGQQTYSVSEWTVTHDHATACL